MDSMAEHDVTSQIHFTLYPEHMAQLTATFNKCVDRRESAFYHH